MNLGFTKVPNEIFEDEDLSFQEKLFLIVLLKFDHKGKGVVHPTYKAIMKYSGINRKEKISAIISNLEDKGYLIKKKLGRINHYYFVKDYLLANLKSRNGDQMKIPIGAEDGSYDVFGPTGGTGLGVEKKIGPTGGTYFDFTKDKKGTDGGTDEKIIGSNGGQISEVKGSHGGPVDIWIGSYGGPVKESNGSNGGTPIGSNGGTPIIKDKNKENIYITILKKWNSNNINNALDLSKALVSSMDMALKKYTLEDILLAIEHYGEVYSSRFYYSYKWSLQTFLIRPKGMDKFVDKGDMWSEYTESKLSKKHIDFNAVEFID